MAHHDAAPQGTAFDDLHPVIYKALAGLALWLVVSAWVFFGSEGYYAGFAVAVVTGFFLIAAAIPFVMWRVWRKHAEPGEVDPPKAVYKAAHKAAFSDWWRGKVETWQGSVEGWDAAVEVLMPLGVAAVGMTLIGLVFRLTAGG
jgi:hypothetical protein